MLLPLQGSARASGAQQVDPVEALLAELAPEERVGQLFLITFEGATLEDESPILSLIRDWHIAGVVLQAKNDNFTPSPGTASALSELTSGLQQSEYEASLSDEMSIEGRAVERSPTYIPLLIAVSDSEIDAPLSRLIPEMSNLPSQMAIGATWDQNLARDTGDVLGRELEALGVNMLLGPSLDVLEDPAFGVPGDLGVNTFGGDPFWVSEMGEAYVDGLHSGSLGRLAVIAKHFPGHGGSDRPLAEQVSTVRKSLEQLMQIELPPFFRVTSGAPGSDGLIVDGLLTSHTRYQGFQGNIRAQTRPISLDPDAYLQLMSLEPLATWRAAGGVTVSDSLGSQAIRRFRELTAQRFNAQLVARDALLAGNDLLYLSDFQDPNDPDELTTIRSTMQFFAQKYREDPIFAQRVDDAVRRVLRLKLRLYGGAFLPARVEPSTAGITALGRSNEAAFSVARRAATLINPATSELRERVGSPQQLGERIVFFTDVRMLTRCSYCPSEPTIGLTAIENRIISLYGPGASGQVGTWNLRSFSMADLANYLGDPPPSNPVLPIFAAEEVDEAVRGADWLIFAVLNMSDDVYGADALKQFIDLRPALAQDARVVVLGFDVPYGLDATTMSNVDVYYALYAATSPFYDVAVRLLFEELSPQGASPVSVPGVGYNLIEVLQPDPAQVISLRIRGSGGEATPTAREGLSQGSQVTVETGVIRDRNGHPVPDNTPVEFILRYPSENITQTLVSVTAGGVGQATFRLDRLGLLNIEAHSDPALRSDVLTLDVQEGVPAFPTVIAPTPLPTETAVPIPTVPAIETPDLEAPIEESRQDGSANSLGWSHLLLGMVAWAVVAGGGYYLEFRRRRQAQRAVRLGLVGTIGALLAYNYLALGLPGSQIVMPAYAHFATVGFSLLGGGLAVLAYRQIEGRRSGKRGGRGNHE